MCKSSLEKGIVWSPLFFHRTVSWQLEKNACSVFTQQGTIILPYDQLRNREKSCLTITLILS